MYIYRYMHVARTEQPVIHHALRLAGGEEVGLVRQQHARDAAGDVVRQELLPLVDGLEAVVLGVGVLNEWFYIYVYEHRSRHGPLPAADVQDEEDAGHLAEE